MLLSSLMVISSRNPVHSVLFLILAFFNAAGLFVILHAEFLAMILIIVYVGAVAVLFLFVVMMLDFRVSLEKSNILQYMPIGIFVGLVFISELVIVLVNTKLDLENIQILSNPLSNFGELTNTEAIGSILYTDYILYFQVSGIILLVAMVGSIVLTLREREGVKRQSIPDQLSMVEESGVGICKNFTPSELAEGILSLLNNLGNNTVKNKITKDWVRKNRDYKNMIPKFEKEISLIG